MHSDRKPVAAARLRSLSRRTAASFAALFTVGALAACGNTYRPVVSSINPVGPAGQPTKYAVAISSTGPNTKGLVTFVDFSGDTIVNTTLIGVNPKYFQLAANGFEGYTLNGDGTLNSFSISSSLLASEVLQSTLYANSNPVSLYNSGTYTYIAEGGRPYVAELSGTPPAIQQELPTGTSPIYTVGVNASPRIYAIVPGAVSGANGTVVPIESASNTIDSPIPVGVAPVYGVMTSDSRRAFILNSGSNNVTVINAQTNAADSYSLPNPIPVGVSPIWADFAPTKNELLVVNNGDQVKPGTVTIVSIPLCSSAALPSTLCPPSNPIDAIGFGQVVANVTVGINPIMIAVLQDGTEAFVANAGNPSLPCSAPATANPVPNCSISIINLETNTVIATVPAVASTNQADAYVHGRPNYIGVTTGTPTGKAYVVAGDSTDISIIRSDINAIQTHLPLQGTGVSVRMNQP